MTHEEKAKQDEVINKKQELILLEIERVQNKIVDYQNEADCVSAVAELARVRRFENMNKILKGLRKKLIAAGQYEIPGISNDDKRSHT